MNRVCEILEEASFVRTNFPLSQPLVVHGVPGSGKTTVVKKLLKFEPALKAITAGVPFHNFDNSGLHKKEESFSGEVDIVDEYPIFDLRRVKSDLVLCDPFQHSGRTLDAHYISLRSHRFGRNTASLLKTFGLNIVAEKEDEVEFGCCFTEDPEGTIIAFEPDIVELLIKHQVQAKLPEEVLGNNDDVVTFYTSKEELRRDDQEFNRFYISLTRHKRKLKILSPDASFKPTRSF